MSPLIPSHRDLADEAARTQARYELLRAIDLGDQKQQAEWTLNWGEAALQQVEDGIRADEWDWGYFGPSEALTSAAVTADDLAETLAANLASETPDMAEAQATSIALRRIVGTINDKLQAVEE